LRREIERLLGAGQIAGLIGLARLIHGLGDVVGKRRTCQQAKRRQQPNHRNRAENTGPCHDRPLAAR